MHILELVILLWVALVVITWLIIRRTKPQILGLGKSRNFQRIDNVLLNKCSKCGQGELEPVFIWWRYFLCIGLPPGIIYLFGTPNKYRCSQCGNEAPPPQKSNLLTRISLTQHLPKIFIIIFITQFIIGLAIMIIIAHYVLKLF